MNRWIAYGIVVRIRSRETNNMSHTLCFCRKAAMTQKTLQERNRFARHTTPVPGRDPFEALPCCQTIQRSRDFDTRVFEGRPPSAYADGPDDVLPERHILIRFSTNHFLNTLHSDCLFNAGYSYC